MDPLARNIHCKCGKLMNEEEFYRHFQQCQDFKTHFRKFDSDFGGLLQSFAEPQENLIIIRLLLKQYITVLERKIHNYLKSKQNNIPKNVPPKQYNNNMDFPQSIAEIQKSSINQVYPQQPLPNQLGNQAPINKLPVNMEYSNNNVNNNLNPIMNNWNDVNNVNKMNNVNYMFDNKELNDNKGNDQFQEQGDLSSCQMCKTADFTYLECCHPICIPCFIKYAKSDFPNMKCKVCHEVIQENFKKMVLGSQYDEIDKHFMYKNLGNVIECPCCKELNSFEPGVVDYHIKDENNVRLSKEAAEDYAKNRCRCGSCQNNFCIQCKATPYHVGKTCLQFANHKKALKCKYDGTEIKANNIGPDVDVCNNPDCIERFKSSCKKVLPCGHKCFGCKDELKCPPCLVPDCPQYGKLFDQDVDSYCNICFTEGLGQAPVLLLSCNHYVHYHCLKHRLVTRWIGPKITFNHCKCPVCNNWYECPSNAEIQKYVAENKVLYKDICEKALKRLKFEDLDKDPKLTDKNSPWYGKNLEYALKRLSYYMCYICKMPYFAGRRECGDGPNVDNDNPNKNYDPKDCVCGKHANLSGVAGITNCKIHGKDFIEYKCKFCCKIASWFCWGTTHFCEDCHARQCKGDYISKYPKEKLPKCDPKKCELKINHPPNGEEFALGCSVCRNNEENFKNF